MIIIEYLRVQTFYPIERKEELDKLKGINSQSQTPIIYFMIYSRKKLNTFLNSSFDKIEYDTIAQDLITNIFEGKSVSLAEESFACSIISHLRHPFTNKLAYDISKIEACKNYFFKKTYIRYSSDLNGHKIIRDAFNEIPVYRKKLEVAFLENEYKNWEGYLNTKLTENKLIGYVAKETKLQLQKNKKYCEDKAIGIHDLNYLKKSLVLHSKYIYLIVKEAFQEYDKEELIYPLRSNNILIDSYSYVHILFRHYSKSIKKHQFDKSYHFDENIIFNDIPNLIIELLQHFSKSKSCLVFNNQNIFLRFRENDYAIWFKKIKKNLKGSISIEYLRVQTFYPIERKEELDKLKGMKLEIVNDNYGFYL